MPDEKVCPRRGSEAEIEPPLDGGICCVHGSPGCEYSNGKPIDWSRKPNPYHDDGCCACVPIDRSVR